MILCKVVEYYVFFICAKSRHCSWKSTRDIFVYVCFSVFVHVNCATDHADYLLFMLCSLFGEHLMRVSVMLQMFSLHQNFLYHHDFPLCSIHFLKQSEMV